MRKVDVKRLRVEKTPRYYYCVRSLWEHPKKYVTRVCNTMYFSKTPRVYTMEG